MQKLKAIHRALLNLVWEMEEEERKFSLVTNTIITKANAYPKEGEIGGYTQSEIQVKPRVKIKLNTDSLSFESEMAVLNAPVSRPLVLKTLPRIYFVLVDPKDQALFQAIKGICKEYEELAGGSLDDYRSLEDFKFFLSLLASAL